MESLINLLQSTKPEEPEYVNMSGKDLLTLLTRLDAVKRFHLREATEYFVKLINNPDHIKSAISYLFSIKKEIKLTDCDNIIPCVIIKQQVLDKLYCSELLVKTIFPHISWTVSPYCGSKIVINSKVQKTYFCAGIFMANAANISLKYKPSLLQQGYPNIASLLVKLLYSLGVCMQLYSTINTDTLASTMKLAGDVDVRNVNIQWKYEMVNKTPSMDTKIPVNNN